jgi:hypothetical protein
MPRKTNRAIDPNGAKKQLGRTLTNKRVKARQDAFLVAYGQTGTVTSACKAAAMDRSSVYEWRTKDVQNFKIRFENANEIFREGLQDLALSRIKDQRPDGNPVLLITMLNACWPEKYRRDAYRADDGARELMGEWKKWKKDQERAKKTGKSTGSQETEAVQADYQELEERKNAIDEVEKILARRKDAGTENGSKGNNN